MSELTPEAVALLEAARQNHGPSDADRRRVLATLHMSLGIGVPVALAPAAAEALSSGQGAVQATNTALQGASASMHGAGSAAAGAAHGAGAAAASQVAVQGGAKGALGLAGKLLTWKAGKLLLASVALSSAVGIGVSVAPRPTPDAPAPIVSKAGQATSFAVARVDAGTSSSPAPTPSPDREPTAIAAAAVAEPSVTLQEAAPQPLVAEPTAALVPQTDPVLEPARLSRTSVRGHGRHHGSRSQHTTTSTHATKGSRTALVVPASVVEPADKPRTEPPVEQPLAAPSEAPVPTQVEVPNELALIRKAMTSLRDRDPARALALLDEHGARFPSGSFTTERRGLRVVALCASGKLSDGRREQAAFLKSFASSPIAARVRGACGEHDD